MKTQNPNHLAIIMDGNGRWAELKGRPRTFGHLRGARVAREIIEACSRRGLKQLTLYAFSTENWLRPLEEVSFLMGLLSRHLKRERESLVKNGIRFQAIGELERLPEPVLEEVRKTIQATAHCNGMLLTFALSYGGRQEILEASRRIATEVAAGRLKPDDVTDSVFTEFLPSNSQAPGLTDPDMVIRTSGESRLSNFMLWQCAYSEILISDVLWPDFEVADLEAAFDWFSGRERRFGKTSAQVLRPVKEKALTP